MIYENITNNCNVSFALCKRQIMITFSISTVPWTFITVTNNHIGFIFMSFSWHAKGAHVTITARSSDDVEESVVLEKVKKASGSNKIIMCGCH